MAAQTEDKKLDGAGLSVLWGLIKNIIPTVPTNVSSFTNDAAYVSQLETHNQNLVLASPNGASGLPSFRALVAADIPDLSGTYLTSASLNGYATQSWVTSQGFGTVSSIKVGTTSYSPSSGVVSLPAYPTTLPASDVYSWAKASSKPSYSWSEIGSRPTKLSEFTNDSGFITGITSSMVTTALGFTPANSTSLSSYLPLSGGTMTGDLNQEANILLTKGGTNQNRVFGIKRSSDGKNIDVGWSWDNTDGSGAFFRSVDHASEGGRFGFFARNGSSTTQLVGTPAGSLTWGGNEIMRQGDGFCTNATGVKTDEYGNLQFKGSDTTNHWGVSTSGGTKIFYVKQNGSVGINVNPSYTLQTRYTTSASKVVENMAFFELNRPGGASADFNGLGGRIIIGMATNKCAILEWKGTNDWANRSSFNIINKSIDGGELVGVSIRWDGNVGIGTTSPSYKLHVDGDVGATAFTNTSDIRNKDFISDTSMSIEQIANAPSFLFKWKTGDDRNVHAGSSAQYWQTVLPEIITAAQDEQHTLSMQYDVIALLSSIAIAKEVVNDKERIRQLEQRVSQLEAQLAN